MDDEGTWSRGRSGWGVEGGGRGLREGETHSPRRLHHSGSPSHKHRPSRPVWDDTVHDLASMRLTPAELARKLASRQSANKVQARAQLLEQTRRSGSQGITIPPTLAARLHARQQSMDSVLAQSSATLLASQRTRHTDASPALPVRTAKQRHHSDGDTIPEERGSREDILRNLRLHQEKFGFLTNDSHATSNLKLDTEVGRGRLQDFTFRGEGRSGTEKEQGQGNTVEDAKVEKQQSAIKDSKKTMDANQLAATRTSLDHTITMVVNTCRELWLQLEEERLTREHLQHQLQQQGNVITSLTSELLLIQDQQEAIIQEVSDARASGLLGVDTDLGGVFSSTSSSSMTRGEDLMGSRSVVGRALGVKTNPLNPAVSRHPQRSILKATRTIHTPHMRQSPPYQVLMQTGRMHQVNTHLPTTQHAPPSPRPHQPTSRLHSQLHQSSPPPESSLSQSGLASSRPDPRTLASYRSSVSQQIRDALVNDQIDRSNTTTPLSFMASEEEALASEKSQKLGGDSQPIISTANKENCLVSDREDLSLDTTLADQLERK